ncbi:MAG: hypothetical protein ACE5D8_03755 [Fidelibacterota bacterium]
MKLHNPINRNRLKPFIGITGGALAGFAYYYFIGCKTGTCAITGHPLNATVFGSIIGILWTLPEKGKN